jgi:hypothetical protein
VKQRVLLILTAFIGLLFNLNVFIKPIGTLPQEKIGVERAGIYNIDIPFLSELGKCRQSLLWFYSFIW